MLIFLNRLKKMNLLLSSMDVSPKFVMWLLETEQAKSISCESLSDNERPFT